MHSPACSWTPSTVSELAVLWSEANPSPPAYSSSLLQEFLPLFCTLKLPFSTEPFPLAHKHAGFYHLNEQKKTSSCISFQSVGLFFCFYSKTLERVVYVDCLGSLHPWPSPCQLHFPTLFFIYSPSHNVLFLENAKTASRPFTLTLLLPDIFLDLLVAFLLTPFRSMFKYHLRGLPWPFLMLWLLLPSPPLSPLTPCLPCSSP